MSQSKMLLNKVGYNSTVSPRCRWRQQITAVAGARQTGSCCWDPAWDPAAPLQASPRVAELQPASQLVALALSAVYFIP